MPQLQGFRGSRDSIQSEPRENNVYDFRSCILDDPNEQIKRISNLELQLSNLGDDPFDRRKKCLERACYFIKGLLLLGFAGASACGAYYVGKNTDEAHSDKYGAAAIFLAMIAAAFLVLTGAYFFKAKKPWAYDFFVLTNAQINAGDERGYSSLVP